MTVEQDVYTRVTNKIIADLEKGNLTWFKPWKSKDVEGCVSLPLRSDEQPYRPPVKEEPILDQVS